MSIVFDVPLKNLGENTSPETLEAWDSFNHMKLIVALEEEFDVQFEGEDILDMKNYKLVKFILAKYLEKAK